ncbi:MAG: ankyrin repeat domain-containing protein [Pirellulaceae bacterium]|nr:ankyrin repeat domain-containing protein [Pirellulaceae bacterium]
MSECRSFTDSDFHRFFSRVENRRICKAISDFDGQTLDQILANGIDLNQQEQNGLSVLFWAFLEGNLAAFEKLLEHGSNPDLKISDDFILPTNTLGFEFVGWKDDTVLFAILRNLCYRHRFLNSALMHTQNPKQIDVTGATLLHVYFSFPACRNKDMVTQLIDVGVDLDAKDQNGATAMKLAINWGYPELCLLLLDAGANPSIPDQEGKNVYDVVNKPTIQMTDEKLAAFLSLKARLGK